MIDLDTSVSLSAPQGRLALRDTDTGILFIDQTNEAWFGYASSKVM